MAVRAAAFGVALAATSSTWAQAPQLMAAAAAPTLNLATPSASYSSSVSDMNAAAVANEHFDLSAAALDAKQPPPRRRYGRPNYADSHTNADGSSKYAFVVGAGAGVPVNDTGKYLTPNYTFQVGGGRNFNKNFGVLLQFDWSHFGFTGPTLANQQAIYNSYCTAYYQATGQCSLITNLDGSTHIWSFTLNPTYTFWNSGKSGAYVVGGVGFFHKRADFTVPSVGESCYIYGCYEYQANQTIDDYDSNAFGLDGGIGLTYKPSRFANERFYTEARIVWTDNSPRAYNANVNNFYPPNANQTYYIPVTLGLRF